MAEPLANQEVSPANAIEPLPLVAVAIFLIFALFHVRTTNQQPDFFIYRLGAELALRGESPYNLALIRTHVVAQFPNQEEGPDSFVNNCGYFLPPMAVLIYAPFAVLPWPAAKIAWAIVSTIAVFGITRIPTLFLANGRRTTTAGADRAWNSYVPILLVVYVLMLAIFQVGQTTTLCVGCVALGQWCFEKGRPSLGLLLWSVAFIKPHVALPLVPLAWYLGGWKRAAALLGLVAVLNVAGASIIRSPMALFDYLDFLAAGHKVVAFNLVSRNYEITSWNRLLFITTGVLIEQTAITTLASYSIWFGLVLARCAIAGTKPSAAWAAAAAAVGAVWCPQVLAYEVFFLALVVPWLRELFEAYPLPAGETHFAKREEPGEGQPFPTPHPVRSPRSQSTLSPAGRGSKTDYRLRGLVGAILVVLQFIPFDVADAVGVDFHRPLAVALLAALVLLGPVKR